MLDLLVMSVDNNDEGRTTQAIYDLYYKQMYATAYRILNNHHDTLDAVQDAFCHIYKTEHVFTDLNTPQVAALTCIYTRNAAINIYNKNKRWAKRFVLGHEDIEESILHISDESADLERMIVRKEESEILQKAVMMLDDKYRDVIELKFFYNMRNTDIAEVLHTNINTISSRLLRALKKLKEILEEWGYEPTV